MKIAKLLTFNLLIIIAATAAAQSRFTDDIDTQAYRLLNKMTTDEKLAIVSGVDLMYTHDIPRLGISRMRMADGPQGVRSYGLSTAYPSTVMLAATWNENLAHSYGAALGSDCRARGVNFILGPGVNIYRSPLNGRNFEYMGEDPYLTSRTAVNYIKGVQEQGVIATVKHFFGNNSEYDRNYTSNDMDERTMHEIYFPAFKAAVMEAGVGAVMSSYNPVNGIYTAESPWLLKDILRNRWGFRGIMMSDWDAVHHGIPAFTAGLDLNMPGSGKWKPEELAYHLKTGHITMEMLDAKVMNILRTYLAFNAKDNLEPDSTIPLNNPVSAQVALDVAREGLVLLKNDNNFLPINTSKVKKIVLVGSNAPTIPGGGGSGHVDSHYLVPPLKAIKKMAGHYGIEVKYLSDMDVMPEIMFTDNDKSSSGLKSEFFNNENLEGQPVASRTDRIISHLWIDGPGIKGIGKEHFSTRWSGKMITDKNGTFELKAGADDGFRLIVDGDTIIDEWKLDSYRTKSVQMTLEANRIYDIRFETFQNIASAAAHLSWKNLDDTHDYLIDRLNDADIVIACVGHNGGTESESFDRTITLPDEDDKLMQRLTACKTPVVAVVNSGGNVILPDYIRLKALLWAWFPGQEGGTAVAEALFGEINPSGKLPMTFEKRWEDNPTYNSYHDADGDKHVAYTEGIFVGYRGYDKFNRDVLYPFGHGLSYTSFRIDNATVSQPDSLGNVTVKARLTNTGRRDGAQVVQIYVGRDTASPSLVARPVRELKGYQKVYLKAGQSADVTIRLNDDAFKYYDTTVHDFVVEPGQYNIDLGFSSRDIKASRPVIIR